MTDAPHEIVTMPVRQVSDTVAMIAMIERVVMQPGANIEMLERLLTMQEKLLAMHAKSAYDAALSRLQPKLPVIERKGRIVIRERGGGDKIIQSTPYALWEDINEAIKPALGSEGFALSFRVGLAGDGKITVTGILSHAEGHREETTITLPHDSTGSKNAVQAVGSSTSYGKRYTASALLNLTSRLSEDSDDDGQAAGGDGLMTDEQAAEITKLVTDSGADINKFLTYMGVPSVADIPAKLYQRAVDALEARKAKKGDK